jgi:hypothetical protein
VSSWTAGTDTQIIRRYGQPDQTILTWAGGNTAGSDNTDGGLAAVDPNAMIQHPFGDPLINLPYGRVYTRGYVLLQW